MPRYYFHILKDHQSVVLDEEGTDLRDLEAAKLEAIEDHLAFATDALRRRRPLPYDYRIDICDERGKQLVRIPFADAVARLAALA